MGMFDTILVSTDLLPVSDKERAALSDAWFQTKAFNRLLESIEIKDGRLMQVLSDDVRLDLNYEGKFNFYTLADDSDFDNGPVDKWHWYEFEAHFSNGNLVNITKIEDQ
jgi:hypothetical protein